MSGKEALNLPRRLEPLHDPLSSSGRLMGVFGPVIEALVLPMLDPGVPTPLSQFACVVSEPVGVHLRSLHRLWSRKSRAICAPSQLGGPINGETFNACETAWCGWSCRADDRNSGCTSGFRARPERHRSQPQ